MAVAWLFSLWHLAQFRNLSSAARSARRTVTRLRLVIAARYGPADASPPASCLTFSHSNKTDLADCIHRATVFTPTSIPAYRTLCLTPHNLWKGLRMQHQERGSIVWDKLCCNSSFGAPPTNTVYMKPSLSSSLLSAFDRGSIANCGAAICFGGTAAQGGESSLWEGGKFYASYVVGFSPLMVCLASSGELWLMSIPPQVSWNTYCG